MTFRYYDGKVDERYCIGLDCSGGLCEAIMVNDDYSTDRILYDDYDRQDARKGEPKVDCPREIRLLVREKEVLGQNGYYAEPGDIVEVVKGRKYPIGMKMAVVCVRNYANDYSRGWKPRDELFFGSENGYEAIAPENVRIIAIKGGSQNQEEYSDVHELAVYKNGREVLA